MDKYNGTAGKSTREMAEKRRKTAIWIAIGGLLLLTFLWVFVEFSTAWGLGAIGFIVLVFGFPLTEAVLHLGFTKKIHETKRAIRGAKAEEKIDKMLSSLPEDYYILNDIECPFGNIDHVVISKHGKVFLIETKAHGGQVTITTDKILVNGKDPEKDFITQTLNNTYWLRDELIKFTGTKVWITPIIVFTNAFVSSSKPIKGIRIINKKYLPALLSQESKPDPANNIMWEQKEEIREGLRLKVMN